MIGLIVLAQPIIETLFEHGAFRAEDTRATAAALRAYALGIPGFLLVKVFAADFFARHDTKTPVQAAIVSMIANVFLSILFLGLLQHIGIALANSLAVTLNAALHYRHLRKKNFPLGDAKLPRQVVKITLCAALMALATVCATQVGWDAATTKTLVWKIATLSALIGVSALSYAAALQATGTLRLKGLRTILTRK